MVADLTEPDDEPTLTDVQQNPWYVLMTLAGEQEEVSGAIGYDPQKHRRNRRLFNAWSMRDLLRSERQDLYDRHRISEDDIQELRRDELNAIRVAFDERCPNGPGPEEIDLRCDLSNCRFAKPLVCKGFMFRGPSSFENSIFSSIAVFESANFFQKEMNFKNITFKKGANFSFSEFNQSVDFSRTISLGGFNFRHSYFNEYAIFNNMHFGDWVDFQSSRFNWSVYFHDCFFEGSADFEGVEFCGLPQFSDSRFRRRTSFGPSKILGDHRKRTMFEKEPPLFFGAELHEDTAFTDVKWPPIPYNRDLEDRRELAIQHRRSYERLKLVMAKQNRVGDELLFQKLELRCREVEEAGTLTARLWRAFGYLSDYGLSVSRPLMALATVWAVGAALIGVAEWGAACFAYQGYDCLSPPTLSIGQTGFPERHLSLGQAMGLSISNTFAFLGMGFHIMRDEVNSLTGFSELVSGVQMFVGPLLLLLLGNSIRNRFRMN